MDIKQLTAFVTVAELGSVTRAADSLHLTQSSVTRQIQALEQELGVTLFERTRNGMTLTIAGRVMAERSRSALLELGRAEWTSDAEWAPYLSALAYRGDEEVLFRARAMAEDGDALERGIAAFLLGQLGTVEEGAAAPPDRTDD